MRLRVLTVGAMTAAALFGGAGLAQADDVVDVVDDVTVADVVDAELEDAVDVDADTDVDVDDLLD